MSRFDQCLPLILAHEGGYSALRVASRVGDGSVNVAKSNKRLIQRRAGNADVFGYLSDGALPATPRNFPRRNAVQRLRHGRRPPAISRLVSERAVDAVKRHSVWAKPHVRQEVFKTPAPAIAYGDASAAVNGKLLGIRIVAPLSGGLPRPVSASPRQAMSAVARASQFPLDAAATRRVSAGQFMARLGRLRAAVASANPLHAPAVAGRGGLVIAP